MPAKAPVAERHISDPGLGLWGERTEIFGLGRGTGVERPREPMVEGGPR